MPEISAIEPQKLRKDRVSVFIDGKFAFGLSEIDVLYYHLKPGAEISQAQIDNIVSSCVFQKAMDKALRKLSARPRTEFEIRGCLKDFCSDDIIDSVISKLYEYKYLDDAAVAAEVSQSLSKRGKGRGAIVMKLRQMGVDRDVISEMPEPDAEEDTENCVSLLKKKYSAFDKDLKLKKKCFDFLARRGYNSTIIKKSVHIFFSD